MLTLRISCKGKEKNNYVLVDIANNCEYCLNMVLHVGDSTQEVCSAAPMALYATAAVAIQQLLNAIIKLPFSIELNWIEFT